MHLNTNNSSFAEHGAFMRDVIVAVAHVSFSDIATLIGSISDKPDVVIEGHDHRDFDPVEIDGVLVTSAGQHQAGVGVVTLTLDSGNNIVGKDATMVTKQDVEITLEIRHTDQPGSPVVPDYLFHRVPGDPEVKDMAELIRAEVIDSFSEVIASSEITLSSERGSNNYAALGVRNSEQALGNLIADAMRVVGGADVAIQNGGGIRADIVAGSITKGHINSVLPFGNTLVIKEATAKDLKDILERALRDTPNAAAWFPQVSGISVAYNPEAPAGEKVVSMHMNGTALNPSDDSVAYRLAVNDFMANGGDGFTVLPGMGTLEELGSLDAIFESYIVSLPGSAITAGDAQIEGRIEITDRAAMQFFTVTFDPNGGTVAPGTREVAEGSAVGELPIPARRGFRFGGWFTAATGGTEVMPATLIGGDVTFYARWAQGSTGQPQRSPQPASCSCSSGSGPLSF